MPRYPVPAGSRPRMRTGRRKLVRLLIVLVILAALLEGADVLSRHLAQDAIAGRAVKASGASAGTSHISGWPILFDFFADDTIPSVSLQLQNVPITTSVRSLTVQEIDVTLTTVGVSAGTLVSHRALRLTGIAGAAVRAVVTDSELSQAAGATVESLPGGRVGVLTANGLVSATVGVAGDVLTVSSEGRQVLRIDFARDRLVPRCSMTTAVSTNQVVASCSVSPVPPSLLAAISAQA